MAGPISLGKRTLVAKLEAARGTAVALANADFDVAVYGITMSNEIAEFARKYMTGDHDSFASVMGRQKGTVGLTFDLVYSGDADTEPKWMKFLKACGVKTVPTANTNIILSPDKSRDGQSLTLYIQDEVLGGDTPGALVYKYKGCVGNAKISMDEGGQPLKAVCEFQGALFEVVDVGSAAILEPTGLDTTVPDSVLSATITVAGVDQALNKFELDFGNKVELENRPQDPTGYRAAYISARDPKLTIDPQAGLLSEDNVHTRWKGGTEAVFALETDHFRIEAQKAQLMTVGDAAQGGVVAWNQVYRLNRVADGSPWTFIHQA
jgi:hypothetical protein